MAKKVREEVADGLESVADKIRGKKDKKEPGKKGKEEVILSADPISTKVDITPPIKSRRKR